MVTPLKTLRQELNPPLLPEQLALDAGLRAFTYMNIENGRRTKYSTATKILMAFNKARVERSLGEVKLEDLGINLS